MAPRCLLGLRFTLVLALGGALAGHFAATALYVTPPNPLRLALGPVLQRYMGRVFAQNWRLFAPDPPYMSKTLFVGCRLSVDGREEDTDLVDVSSRLVDAAGKRRLSPAGYLARAVLAPTTEVFAPEVPEERLLRDKDDPRATTARELLTEDRERLHREGLSTLVRVAETECRRLHPGRPLVAVRPVVDLEDAAPFSARRDPAAPRRRRAVDLQWHVVGGGAS